MQKYILILLIAVSLCLKAMDDSGRGYIPSKEELAVGYIPTAADIAAGYVPLQEDIENNPSFMRTAFHLFEATQNFGQKSVRTEISFDMWGEFKEHREDVTEIEFEEVPIDPIVTPPASKKDNKVLSYLMQHKLKLGALCAGLIGMFLLIRSYGKNGQELKA